MRIQRSHDRSCSELNSVPWPLSRWGRCLRPCKIQQKDEMSASSPCICIYRLTRFIYKMTNCAVSTDVMLFRMNLIGHGGTYGVLIFTDGLRAWSTIKSSWTCARDLSQRTPREQQVVELFRSSKDVRWRAPQRQPTRLQANHVARYSRPRDDSW